MAIEGLDAGLPIETAGFVPLAEVSAAIQQEAGPTLDMALREAGRADQITNLGLEAMSDRAAMRAELAEPDLWIGPGRMIRAAPGASDANTADLGSGAPEGNGSLFPELSITEKKLVANGSRYGDSTELAGWDEISTGTYDWAVHHFMSDLDSAVARATQSATSQAQVEQIARDYLNSIGLGELVHVNSPTPTQNGDIIVVGHHDHPSNPLIAGPVLSMNYWLLNGLNDPHSTYQTMDEDAITVDVQTTSPLTPEQEEAVARLHAAIEATTALLNALPANGVFTFPDGTQITVAELRALWAKTDFVVTDRTFDNGTPSLPSGGAAHRNGGDPLFEVNVNSLVERFMANPSAAMWYPLHELAHVTGLGDALNAMYHANGLTNYEHNMNEAFANAMAIAIGEAATRSYTSGFLGQMESSLSLVPRPTFSVPGSSGTGGGTSGGGTGGGETGGGGGVSDQ
jgi:hypothetical protein